MPMDVHVNVLEDDDDDSGSPLILGKPRAARTAPMGGKWNHEEDEDLKRIVNEQGPKNWRLVSLSYAPPSITSQLSLCH